MSTPVTPHDFPEIRWRGHWIWVPEEPIKPSSFLSSGINPQAPEAHSLFRKEEGLTRKENQEQRTKNKSSAFSCACVRGAHGATNTKRGFQGARVQGSRVALFMRVGAQRAWGD